MRNVVYVAPFPLDATMRFSRGLATLADVRLLGVFQQAPRGEAGSHFASVVEVRDALDPDSISQGIAQLQQRWGPIHRITGILEPLQTPLAHVRRRFDVAGPDPETAERFRDKALMKETLRAHGIPCARHRLLHNVADGMAFAELVGLPVVLKPPAGAGCRATWRIDDTASLQQALEQLRPSAANPILAEEFLRGREYSFEMVVLGGQVVASSMSQYLPSPLEVMQTPWIQWVCLLPRHVDGPELADVRAIGAQVVQSLGLEDGVAHMEWFRREDGSLAVGEIAARPPGGQLTAMTGLVHDVDIYRTWARAVVDSAFDGPWQRKYAAATVFLRGIGRGRVARVDGLDEAQALVGALVEEVRLPRAGAPKSDTYEGDGYVILRHADETKVREAVQTVLDRVRVHYT